jgi:hypothetical protein
VPGQLVILLQYIGTDYDAAVRDGVVAEQIVFLLQYIGTDYDLAVRDGEVANAAEFRRCCDSRSSWPGATWSFAPRAPRGRSWSGSRS